MILYSWEHTNDKKNEFGTKCVVLLSLKFAWNNYTTISKSPVIEFVTLKKSWNEFICIEIHFTCFKVPRLKTF